MRAQFNRHVSFNDLISDRWETANFLGFGEGSSCYNNVLVIGDVSVGQNTWIGPNVILDGRGGLKIGDYVSVSAGVQIYTHDTVAWSRSLGKDAEELSQTSIGNGVYIGPQVVIEKGVTIGNCSIIGANSFVNTDIPSNTKAWGNPAIIIGQT